MPKYVLSLLVKPKLKNLLSVLRNRLPRFKIKGQNQLPSDKSKQVYNLIDRFMTSEGSYSLILPFTSKTGQSVA